MSRLRSAALNGGIGFVLAFVVATVVKNRRAGVKAGIVSAAVSALASWAIYGALEGSDALDELTGDLEAQLADDQVDVVDPADD